MTIPEGGPSGRLLLEGLPVFVPCVAIADLGGVDHPSQGVVSRGWRYRYVSVDCVCQRLDLGRIQTVLESENRIPGRFCASTTVQLREMAIETSLELVK
jgi:hypothetical protein